MYRRRKPILYDRHIDILSARFGKENIFQVAFQYDAEGRKPRGSENNTLARVGEEFGIRHQSVRGMEERALKRIANAGLESQTELASRIYADDSESLTKSLIAIRRAANTRITKSVLADFRYGDMPSGKGKEEAEMSLLSDREREHLSQLAQDGMVSAEELKSARRGPTRN